MVSGYQPASMEDLDTPHAKCSIGLSRGTSVKLFRGYGQISGHIPCVVLGSPIGETQKKVKIQFLPSRNVLSSWRADEGQFRYSR